MLNGACFVCVKTKLNKINPIFIDYRHNLLKDYFPFFFFFLLLYTAERESNLSFLAGNQSSLQLFRQG